MRRIALVSMLAALLVLMVAPAASAHVHGITPLNCAGLPDNGNSGANAAKGGPITGLIPRDVGNGKITIGGGGFQPVNNPHC